MIIKRENIRSAWIWRLPAGGEAVPDHPPVDLLPGLAGDIELVEAAAPEEPPGLTRT